MEVVEKKQPFRQDSTFRTAPMDLMLSIRSDLGDATVSGLPGAAERFQVILCFSTKFKTNHGVRPSGFRIRIGHRSFGSSVAPPSSTAS